ncbi:copper resistance protein B [Massilia sp. TN1-12]|uniref:copper resistance protein B n=1 Tax=Massilia paldalensis TaxID=3377675 RepID=UPI00384FEDD6
MSKTDAAVALLVLGMSAGTAVSAQVTEQAKQGETGQAPSTSHSGSMEGMDHSQMGQPKTDQSKKGQSTMDHSQMDHSQMDHSQMNHANGEQMRAPESSPKQGKAGQGNGMAGMDQGMKMGPMQGGSPPPDARDPNAYAEGTTFADLPGNEMNDEMRFGRILLDNFEYAKGDGEHGQNLDGEAWYGNDYNKAWFKAEGERRDGHLQSLRTEALWDHTFATFWSTQLGVRHDTGGGDSRNWLAFGVRGLAPYWFDTEATAYWTGGRLGARFKVRYELLFTQRLILEPEVEGNLYSGSDPARGLGSGLSDLGLSLRLRYEIRRQFAPYIGVTWAHNYGGTADYARARGERNKSTQIVAGVRIWY